MVWCSEFDINQKIPHIVSKEVPPNQILALEQKTNIDYLCHLNIQSLAPFVRLTTIQCTIGAINKSVPLLEKMVEAGMNMSRFAFTMDCSDVTLEKISNVRQAAKNNGMKIEKLWPITIVVDTKGPEIRTGVLEGGMTSQVLLIPGNIIKLTTDKAYAEKSTAQTLYIDYENATNVIQVGNRIFVNIGHISLICTNIQGSTITCTIEYGGVLTSRNTINLPGVPIDLPGISDKDKDDLKVAQRIGVDIILASFVRGPETILEIKELLGEQGKKMKVFACIENHQGTQNLEKILEVSDGIMIARSDLGIELGPGKLFAAQKYVTATCNQLGIPVMCSTQMLISMLKRNKPTYYECSDIANAILDGADIVSMSDETALGDYPVACIETMSKVCKEAEAAAPTHNFLREVYFKTTTPSEAEDATAIAAVLASLKCIAGAIIVLTTSGNSARLIAKYRPKCPIIAVTRFAADSRQWNLYRGVLPLIYEDDTLPNWVDEVEARVKYGINFGKSRGFIRSGDPIIIVTGRYPGSGNTNTIRVIYTSDQIETLIY